MEKTCHTIIQTKMYYCFDQNWQVCKLFLAKNRNPTNLCFSVSAFISSGGGKAYIRTLDNRKIIK